MMFSNNVFSVMFDMIVMLDIYHRAARASLTKIIINHSIHAYIYMLISMKLSEIFLENISTAQSVF